MNTLKEKNIILIPVDNRPVSYELPLMAAGINSNINLVLPPKKYLGGLSSTASVEKIIAWLNEQVSIYSDADIVFCLDTVAYGGMIPSRRVDCSNEDILDRLNKFRSILEKTSGKIFAFSSIMRISDSNVNDEEKKYWDQYGKKIFRYSFLKHKVLDEKASPDEQHELVSILQDIPEDIVSDYMKTRERNFTFNRFYLSWAKEGVLDYLVYGRDDTSRFGLNIQEAEFLSKDINEKRLSEKVSVVTGADELALVLLTRILVEAYEEKIRIYPVFSTENGANIVPRYEEKKVFESIQEKIALLGAELTNGIQNSDIILLLNTPKEKQNDLALGLYYEPDNSEAVEYCMGVIKGSEKPVIVADIFCANGADNMLVQQILSQSPDIEKIFGYAGWNTAANTIGTALATGISRYLAEKYNTINSNVLKRLLLTRLSDDWAYQTVVRQKIRLIKQEPDEEFLYNELSPYIKNIARKLDTEINNLKTTFPWDRTFEVSIEFD